MASQSTTNGISKITVNASSLYAKAEEVRGAVATIQNVWEGILNLTNGTQRYWNGEAAEQYRKCFTDYTESIEGFTDQVAELAVKLEKIAGVYNDGEKLIQNAFEALPSDLLK